jgi:ArsR family transcriptional regulator, arsenate/arsenite/antimonite-responsive transcriptional repressor
MTSLSGIVQVQKAIAHPMRLRILCMLREGPLCGCQISSVMKLAASTVSEHLSELRRAGLVSEKKEGRWVEYRLDASGTAERLLSAVFDGVQNDPAVRADAIVIRALRRVPLEALCRADLDLGRLERPALSTAIEKAERIRAEAGPR